MLKAFLNLIQEVPQEKKNRKRPVPVPAPARRRPVDAPIDARVLHKVKRDLGGQSISPHLRFEAPRQLRPRSKSGGAAIANSALRNAYRAASSTPRSVEFPASLSEVDVAKHNLKLRTMQQKDRMAAQIIATSQRVTDVAQEIQRLEAEERELLLRIRNSAKPDFYSAATPIPQRSVSRKRHSGASKPPATSRSTSMLDEKLRLVDLRAQLEHLRPQLPSLEHRLNATRATASYNGRWLSAQQSWQAMVQHQLSTEPNDPCRFAVDLIQDFHLLEDKDSASATIVGFGSLPVADDLLECILPDDRETFHQVAVKMSFRNSIAEKQEPGDILPNNSLDVERGVIYEAFRDLLQKQQCPNVVAPLANWTCEGQLDMDQGQRALFQELVSRLPNGVPESVHSLVMERGTGNLASLFARVQLAEIQNLAPVLTEEDFYGILFQIYWALECFYRTGIRHNDLHLGNVLYRKLSIAEDLYYEMPDGRIVHVRTPYVIKIFDMDRGSVYHPHVERNLFLDQHMCALDGECNGAMSLADQANFGMTFLLHLEKQFQSAGMPDQIREWFDYTRVTLFDAGTFANAFARKWNHHWMFAVKRALEYGQGNPEYRRMINAIKPSLECMETLVRDGKVLVMNPDEVDLSGYAMGSAYRLPEQEVVRVGRPKVSMLPREHFTHLSTSIDTGSSPSKLLRQVTALDIDGMIQGLRDDRASENNQWRDVFRIWNDELQEGNVPVTWNDKAAELLHAFLKQSRSFPRKSEEDLALIAACITLTCPMYYGLEPRVQQTLREHLLTMDGPLAGGQLVLAAEQLIWTVFGDELPVQIPLLYDMH